jgi:hypothetical protein
MWKHFSCTENITAIAFLSVCIVEWQTYSGALSKFSVFCSATTQQYYSPMDGSDSVRTQQQADIKPLPAT